MAARLFGTDGVRGVAGSELTCELAFRLGYAAVKLVGSPVVVGKDTRRSGDMLEAALSAGIMSAGGNIYAADIIPTPGVAFLTASSDAQCGIVISASHNPPQFNGIKFFDADGFKLPVALEDKIEAFVTQQDEFPSKTGTDLGQLFGVDEALALYGRNALYSVEEGLDFSGISVALDCGHGAAAATTPQTLEELGIEIYPINTDYEGDEINVECGSTCLDPVRSVLEDMGCSLALAHDGDADRLMALDENGVEVDGDFIEAICAIDMKERGVLAKNTVVTTVMCNMGFVKAMEEQGITVVQTAVGDRNVLECMLENGYNLGGEQSGHMIFLDYNTTGDGLITALQLLSVMARTGKSLSELASCMTRYPQALINVQVKNKAGLEDNEAIAAVIAEQTEALADSGRVLVRPSGTEPIVRVMVEAADEDAANHAAQTIAEVVERELCE